MKRQNGFTLIELVVVIIILGILAVTAAPKFINLQSDARKSTLDGMKGALQGANSLIFSKAAISAEEKKGSADASTTGSVDIGTGTPAATNYGYLQSTATQLTNAMDLSISNDEDDTVDWYIAEGDDGAKSAQLYQAGSARFGNTTTTTNRCYVTYTPTTSTTAAPTYVVTDDDC
ncbi:prepilin-type N-terminal cleavage/methylation domain-containing protein [Shewanella psychropiezotolerans]|uniref:Prepilin-type N-terminal cleavage/methylation domain-containing protein n=1 Tax=Shewanella psychropiezotolerans TaxID=2593655 RepID=A0ABX5WSY0_9GAMM|nr:MULTISPECIES: prepilin-type N-terminal cleavage/methylation domain-containing protein [Shewanella]MPY25887.1 prepilin-type N-terminal cleavage/methylation domain-containing protein [Shewanella sp. YLB-07]QDO82215.1 prepilin-type N-terminal cleavage/methylation domain-containing protein [Shewanella psychropiezotolerans]